MKSSEKYPHPFWRFLVIMSGIILYSILPIEIHFGENSYAHFFQNETEYYSVSSDDSPADEDSSFFDTPYELVFTESSENNEPSAGMNGLAVIEARIHATESIFNRTSLDGGYYFIKVKHLSIDYSLDLLNKATNHFALPFQPFTNSIAINAP